MRSPSPSVPRVSWILALLASGSLAAFPGAQETSAVEHPDAGGRPEPVLWHVLHPSPVFQPFCGLSVGWEATPPDLSSWTLWWEFHRDRYLDPRAGVRSPRRDPSLAPAVPGIGCGPFVTGDLRPTEEQIRGQILPALLALLAESEERAELQGSALVALAKVGLAAPGAVDADLWVRHFDARNQTVGESAVVALGILGSGAAIVPLESLLRDTARGREAVGRSEVSPRLRALAAYALGRIGNRSSSREERERIVGILHEVLRAGSGSSKDLGVACVIAAGMVRLPGPGPASVLGADGRLVAPPPWAGRLGQIEAQLALLADEARDPLLRAHAATAAARLLEGLDAPGAAATRGRVVHALLACLEEDAVPAERLQSAVLALGALGTNDGADALDRRIRAALVGAAHSAPDAQARAFALIAAAEVGGRRGRAKVELGIEEVFRLLLGELIEGAPERRPWAGLAAGIFLRALAGGTDAAGSRAVLEDALRAALRDEKDPSRVGAFALGCSLARDRQAIPQILQRLAGESTDEVRGHLALALGVLEAREAIEPLRKLAEGAGARPFLLAQSSIASALLSDHQVVPDQIELLRHAKGTYGRSNLCIALGLTRDRRAIEPLLAILQDEQATDRSRSFAAAALGGIADPEARRWSACIADGLNYAAAPPTLTDPFLGGGILDVF